MIPFLVTLSAQTDRTGLVFKLLIAVNKLSGTTESRMLDYLQNPVTAQSGLEESAFNTGQEPLDPTNRPISAQEIEGLEFFLKQPEAISVSLPVQNGALLRSFHRIENPFNTFSILILTHAPERTIDSEVVQVLLQVYLNLQKNIQAKDLDPLTGLFNRRSFDETISNILDHAIHNQQPNRTPGHGACLAIFDIDHFKRVNDNYGHAIGDEVLILFGRLMERVFRCQDRLYRFGGEEFLAILTEVNQDKANHALERFRTLLEAYPFPQVGQVTVSIGATMVNRQDFPPVLIEKADKSLYYAKEHGRNQVHFHENLVASGLLKSTDHASDNIELWN
ncbi:MAG: GGDEF domain-containing protein [Magnetococcales bacterium]|nr:GGDEF domain-containing protein [Magnetococcales bacterium]